MCGAKTTWFQCMDRNIIGFCVRAESELFSLGDRLDWFLCGWSRLIWFLFPDRKSLVSSVIIEINLVLVWLVEIDSTSVWGWNLT